MRKLIALLFLLSGISLAQVSVTPNCSLGKCQLFDRNGHPLASGKVYSYDPGSTNLRNTYKDAGGVSQNTDPIILDGGGYASIWLANQAYKFCVYNSANVLQYPCIDNVTGYLGLLNFANTWTFPQTFTSAITDNATDNQFILGILGVQTTLDFPPPAGPVTLHFPNTADTMVGRATTDVLSKKSFTDYPTVGGSFNVVTTLCMNSTQTTQTGDVALHTIYTCSIPGNLLGATRALRITLVLANPVTAGNPIVFIKYGGTTISANQPLPAGGGGQNGLVIQTIGSNIGGATNSQSWDTLEASAFLAGVLGAGGQNHQLSAIDSTATQNLTVTFQGGANTDSVTFYRLLVELL
jgi:hypothetical protein